MKKGDKVVCIGEFCYSLKQYNVYEVDTLWSDNTITLVGYKFNYSESSFVEFNEYRRNKILRIKEKIKGS